MSMVIRRITIRNFGKIHNRTFELSPGINVLYGENESGKTTVHTFLKSMFYGITRQKGKAAKNDVYSAYMPWENPGEFGGTVWFEKDGERFRLTRNFDKEHSYHELMSETSGAVTDAREGSLQRVLGDVSEAVYDNTVSVGQLKSVTGQDLVRELQNYMASYQGTADSSIDLARASQMLKMSRKGYQVQEDHRVRELRREKEELTANMNYLARELAALKEKKDALEAKKKSLPGEEDGKRILEKRLAEVRSAKIRSAALLGLLAVLGVIAAVFLPDLWMKAAGAGLGVLFLMIALARNRSYDLEIRKLWRQREKWSTRQKKTKWDEGNLEASFSEKRRACLNLKKELEDCEAQIDAVSPEKEEAEAITLALSTIEKLSGNIVNQVGDRLQERTSQILSDITGGRYDEVLVDESFHLSVNTEERVVPLERLSRGTLEQIYFALRMAAGELFLKGEDFPVILDDVFGMYDEERLEGVLHWMYKENRQVIISTCSRREMEVLDQEGIPYQKILL